MSIQQYVHDADVGVARRLPNGNYEFLAHGVEVVTYADHVAEVERAVAVALNEVDQVQRLAEDAAVEAMRAACIAAVEALDKYVHGQIDAADALAALREVQP